MARDRWEEASEIANGIYLGIAETLRERKVDAGQGVAICTLLAGWLRGTASAQAMMSDKELADVPYFAAEDDDE